MFKYNDFVTNSDGSNASGLNRDSTIYIAITTTASPCACMSSYVNGMEIHVKGIPRVAGPTISHIWKRLHFFSKYKSSKNGLDSYLYNRTENRLILNVFV
jgi:hypothetical protein